MTAFWPWAHENPILHPIEAFKLASQFNRSYELLFQGALMESMNLPWYYLPWYLTITTPPLVLAFMLAGSGLCVYKSLRAPHADESLLFICLLFWFWFPVVYVIMTHPNIYDGIRHFLFILPAMALLAGVGADWILQALKGKARNWAAFGLICVLVLPVIDMAGLHPYQMTYFNSFVGKVGGAYGKYDTDYWLTSYKECMEWLNNNTDPKDGPVTVLVVVEPLSVNCARYFAAPHIRIALADSRPEDASMPDFLDYFVSSSRFGNHRCFPQNPVVYTVERQGALFALIRQNKPMPEH